MKRCIVPLPIEIVRAPSAWPRISGRVRNRALWFALGFGSALTLAAVVGGILPLPK